jgi:hypothetical protein
MPELTDEEKERIYELEVSLWRPETRFDDDYMDDILTDDFREFGRSGRTYDREDALSVSTGEIDIDLPLEDFRAERVDDGVALVTYVSVVQYEELEVGNRSSLWVKRDGDWKLRFHQGTPTER